MCAGVCVDTHTPTLTYIFLFLLKVNDKTQRKWQGSDLWIKNANASFELGLLAAVSTLASILGKPVFFFFPSRHKDRLMSLVSWTLCQAPLLFPKEPWGTSPHCPGPLPQCHSGYKVGRDPSCGAGVGRQFSPSALMCAGRGVPAGTTFTLYSGQERGREEGGGALSVPHSKIFLTKPGTSGSN